jgi:hypothetical protein
VVRGTFSEFDVADELNHDLGSFDTKFDTQCDEPPAARKLVGIGMAAVGVYFCGLIELVRERRFTHSGWIVTEGERVGLCHWWSDMVRTSIAGNR